MAVKYALSEGSLGELLKGLLPRLETDQQCPIWPPDVFALCAAVLLKTGAYSYAVQQWPPNASTRTQSEWVTEIENVAADWRKSCDISPPPAVLDWWTTVVRKFQIELSSVPIDQPLCEALIQLCSVADELSAGVGLPFVGEHDKFGETSVSLLLNQRQGASLCREIHQSKLRVLPKQHAPRSGITIRSISHHLSICVAADVVPYWHIPPIQRTNHGLNLLLIPWPKTVLPAQFSAASPTVGQLQNMDSGKFGFFGFESERLKSRPDERVTLVMKLVKEALRLVGDLDGVIFPELALTPEQHESIRDALIGAGLFLVCGVGEKLSDPSKPGNNYVSIDIPMPGTKFTEVLQHKHHRWRLDRSQIVQYGLGSRLDPSKEWWEHIALKERCINFVNLRDWLTLCALVCEDLARPDPVGDIVRAVGPNLVIALLMDGPQLSARWPGRYATVLADDPGSSVLTLSSAGMVDLSRPLPGIPRSRSIGLWKDARNPTPVHIDLPDKAEAVVISLTCDEVEEVTADGRADGGGTSYAVLSGLHPVYLSD